MKLLKILTIIFMPLLLLAASPNSLNYGDQDEKIYLDSSNVHILHKGIFLFNEGTFVPITVLRADESGIYIGSDQLASPVSTWICPDCGRANAVTRDTCYNCGYEN